MSIIYLPSRKNYGLAKSIRRAAWMFVFLFALSAAHRSSIGIPPSEQGKVDRATCFLDEIHHPQAGRIADATVFIAVVRSDGTLASEGTGFVVSDSADGGSQGSRIVTAAHVIDNADTPHDGQRFAVFFSDGMRLGIPRTVFRGAMRELSVSGFDLTENDIAVIEISSFNDEAARTRFLGLRGLPLYGGGDILVGEANRPLGVSWGFSGAAAIDPAGRVVGVLTSADFRDRTSLKLGSILDANQSGGTVRQPVILPARSLVIVEPLHQDILRTLGHSPDPLLKRPRTTVTFAGFPTASCAATSATVKPINSRAGIRLISQWRSIGMEGAWYLPPQLGREKILPVSKEP